MLTRKEILAMIEELGILKNNELAKMNIYFLPKGFIVYPEKTLYDDNGEIIAMIDRYGRCSYCKKYVGCSKQRVNGHFKEHLV
jgi:hypothetical protein